MKMGAKITLVVTVLLLAHVAVAWNNTVINAPKVHQIPQNHMEHVLR